MTEPKFTPAPWHTTNDGYNVKNETDIMICLNSFEDDVEQCKANANLIAAAPELYEALVELLNDTKMFYESGDAGNFDCEEMDVFKRVRKALAKARGET